MFNVVCIRTDSMFFTSKIFRVAIYNAVQLDTAVETIFNVLFYLLLGIIIASSLAAIDPFALFSSMIAFFLPLSFLFSAAASKYFEVCSVFYFCFSGIM
jgi:hypothetical protein